jgi:hypothetical protein
VILPGGLSSITATDGVATYLRLTATSIIYAWLYNSTGGSLLIAMLAHLGHNFAAAFMPTPADGGRQHFIVAVGYLLVATLVAVLTDKRTLRRPNGPAISKTFEAGPK